MHNIERLESMIGRAGEFAANVLNDEPIDYLAAREISGECAELLALLNQDWGSFDGIEVIDPELLQLAEWLSDGIVQYPTDESRSYGSHLNERG